MSFASIALVTSVMIYDEELASDDEYSLSKKFPSDEVFVSVNSEEEKDDDIDADVL